MKTSFYFSDISQKILYSFFITFKGKFLIEYKNPIEANFINFKTSSIDIRYKKG